MNVSTSICYTPWQCDPTRDTCDNVHGRTDMQFLYHTPFYDSYDSDKWGEMDRQDYTLSELAKDAEAVDEKLPAGFAPNTPFRPALYGPVVRKAHETILHS